MRKAHRLAAGGLALVLAMVLTLAGSPPHPLLAAHLAGGAPWAPLFESDFTANTPAGWPTTSGSTYSEHVANGRYILSVIGSAEHIVSPQPPLDLTDGRITAVVYLNGRGQVGLAARVNQTDDTGYTFWIARDGRCGAVRLAGGAETTLFSVYDPAIVPAGDNVLTLQASGSSLTFVVNGRPVYSYVDQTPLPAGAWGLYASGESSGGGVAGYYARVTIYGPPRTPRTPSLSAYPFTPMVDYDFAAGNNESWRIGRTPHTNSTIGHGRLTVSTIGGYSIVITPRQFPAVANGQIAAVVRMEGAGRVGVAGRWVYNPDHYYTEYACWMDQRGDVGLTREDDYKWATLFEVQSNRVHPYQDNTLMLRIQGARVSCYINDQHMFTYTDHHPLSPGGWGAWVSDYPGGPYVQGQYAHILIAD